MGEVWGWCLWKTLPSPISPIYDWWISPVWSAGIHIKTHFPFSGSHLSSEGSRQGYRQPQEVLWGLHEVHTRARRGPGKGRWGSGNLDTDRWAGLREATTDELRVRISLMTSFLPYNLSWDLNHQELFPVSSRLCFQAFVKAIPYPWKAFLHLPWFIWSLSSEVRIGMEIKN